MYATLKNLRMSPRKVQLVAALVGRGMPVKEAIAQLQFTPRAAALPMKKLIESAVANAVNNEGRDDNNLFISEIIVNKGPTLKRGVSASRGRMAPIAKRTSHVTVRLNDYSSFAL